MKNYSSGIIKSFSIASISVILFTIVLPFDLFDMKQAQRIAKWKSVYEKIEYSFSLTKLHEGNIIPTETENGRIVSEDYIIYRMLPYLNLENNEKINPYKYGYRKMNGSKLNKNSQFNFSEFFKRKDGVLLGIRENLLKYEDGTKPSYFMFVDINGEQKPNRIGEDIFFISIFKNKIRALGNGKPHAALKANCSPIGGGLYCSEYYLHGGKF